MAAADFITIHGKRLEFAWYGPGPEAAPSLIFLHEGLGCAAMWRDFPARLADATGCGALIFSRLGYGTSDSCELPRPTHFMHDEGLIVMPELIRSAGVRRCILVGHSDGGSIAIIYAGGIRPTAVCGIITEAAHVFCEEQTIRSIEIVRDAYLKGTLKDALEKYHGPNTSCAFRGWSDAWLHPEFRQWNIEAYLPQIRVPMLVIQGEEDTFGTADQVRAIQRQAGAGAQVKILPRCGHSPHRDQPEAVLRAMATFIGGILDE